MRTVSTVKLYLKKSFPKKNLVIYRDSYGIKGTARKFLVSHRIATAYG